ncbi:hypothetical protein [Nocardia sp. NPDC004711]
MAEFGKPQPWPGLPVHACPYRIGDKTGYAVEVLQSAVQTAAEIVQHQS